MDDTASLLWQHNRTDLVEGWNPAAETVRKTYRYGPYGEVEVYVLTDGTAITLYTPTLRYLFWKKRNKAFEYAQAMGDRARILNRMLS